MNTAIIIGGGLGGLFTGAMLAHEGWRVTVLEKNATIGGGLQTFRRFGEDFDTGMHVIGGMREGGNILKICRWLGIADKVRVRPVDDDCTDCLYFAEDRKTYRLRKGVEGFVESLASYFPSEREGLRRYESAIYRLLDEVPLFRLKPSVSQLPFHSEEFMMAADAFIAQYVSDPRLRSVLAYMNPLYGGMGGRTPAYVHAIINILYIEGASRFIGGSLHFASLLADVIRQGGGEVIAGDGVEWMEVSDRHILYVRTRKGKTYQADTYISAIHPCTLLQLMPEKAFPKAFRTRLNDIPNSYSAFSVYVKLKKGSFPYINHSEYYMTRYGDIWNFGQKDKPWPLGFLFMTPPAEGQGQWADKALVTAPMLFDEVREWENTTTGRRGAGYEAWKEGRTKVLLAQIEEIHPGFSACIEAVNAASPLTIRDYYGAKEGTMCGFSKDCGNIVLSQLPVVTKLDNLLLTGQNNNLHGFCGVPLTAIQTCEALLGTNYIVNKINEANLK